MRLHTFLGKKIPHYNFLPHEVLQEVPSRAKPVLMDRCNEKDNAKPCILSMALNFSSVLFSRICVKMNSLLFYGLCNKR